MRRAAWPVAAAAVLAVAIVAVVLLSGGGDATNAAPPPATSTVKVEHGALSAQVSGAGTLTYGARADGSPYVAVNQAAGTYTQLPENGDRVGCGDVLYRVDDQPVLLLCGALPAYRGLRAGASGRDVAQLNRNLHVGGDVFGPRTTAAVAALQRRVGAHVTGALALGQAVFLPEAVRVAKVSGQVGGAARPGTPVLDATSDRLHVRVNLDPAQQGDVTRGDRVQITLPGNRPIRGRVERFGRVAQTPAAQNSTATDATIPTFIALDDPRQARGLDQSPVLVDITTKGVDDALSVPVTALVGHAGGGFAVEVVRPDGTRALTPVRLGLFDDGNGRVQVTGQLTADDAVVVPSL
jgi:hypothetical protein